MRFSALFAGALAAVAYASPTPNAAVKAAAKADLSATVVQQIATLQADVITLNNTLNTFQPFDVLGVITALQIQQQAGNISTDLTNVAATTNASASWNSTNSFKVANAVIGFEPAVFSLLDNLVRKKPAFATAVLLVGDLTTTVRDLLIKQRELSREFGSAVGSRLDPSLAPYAPTITNQILAKFDTAIAAYKSCTGLLCLPDI